MRAASRSRGVARGNWPEHPRDMGAAFGVARVGIHTLVVAPFGSFKLPLVILTSGRMARACRRAIPAICRVPRNEDPPRCQRVSAAAAFAAGGAGIVARPVRGRGEAAEG